MLKILYQKFIDELSHEDKEKAVELIVNEFKKTQNIEGFIDIYTKVLEPALNKMVCDCKDKKICVWKEHVRSAIVKTILENAYPYIIAVKKRVYKTPPTKKAVVICPDGEYHAIGARMVADFFTLANFDTIYVGSSTPKEEFIYAINEVKPDALALSVTNYFNIVSAKTTIEAVKKAAKKCPFIVVGGNAFVNNPNIEIIGADKLLNTFEDIKQFAEEVHNASSN